MSTDRLLTLDPSTMDPRKLHGYLLGAITPRPIAFASTIDRQGVANLAPFSYFNVFSTRPPLLIIGPNRSSTDKPQKDTVNNALETFEVVINLVNWDIVQQMNVASAAFPPSVDEFVKSGLTPIASVKVKPPRVAESPVQFECRVREVLVVGGDGQSGNLIICEVLLMHVKEDVLDAAGHIDPLKLDTVGRMGGNWYIRTRPDALFERPKPPAHIIGWDQLPASIRDSKTLTGNEIGLLAHAEALPTATEIQAFSKKESAGLLKNLPNTEQVHLKLRELLAANRFGEAVLLAFAAQGL